MQATMDELFVGDAIAFQRVTAYLLRMVTILQDLKALLLALRESCDPEVFYRDVRPWLRGADSDINKRKWVFEGIESDPELHEPTELSGPSAGQSSLIHALDIFLGIEGHSPSSSSTPSRTAERESFFSRMRLYMPRHHRAFLAHLSANPRPLRELVSSPSADPQLIEAYNAAVLSLKEFRDAHMIIIALYIVNPARRSRMGIESAGQSSETEEPLKGTGGTNLVKFLKGVRDHTKEAFVSSPIER
jgi:indoleamine 2,3-dioxygenase